MEGFMREIIFIVLVIWVCIWWLLTTKYNAIKKYIVIQGFLLVVSGATYIAMKSLDLPGLSILGLFALIGAIIFLVKAIMFRRKLEKLDNHPTDHSK